MMITRGYSIRESETPSPGTKCQKVGGNGVMKTCVIFILKKILRQSNARGLVSGEVTSLSLLKYFGNIHIISIKKEQIFFNLV